LTIPGLGEASYFIEAVVLSLSAKGDAGEPDHFQHSYPQQLFPLSNDDPSLSNWLAGGGATT
jgi:hypothetical protein